MQQPTPRPRQTALELRPELVTPPADFEEIEPYVEQFRRHFVNGYPDGTFRPDGHMTRAEMLQVFFNSSNSNMATVVATTSRFTDVSPNAWYFAAVVYLENQGIIQGFPDGTLRPNDPITNAEFATLAVNFFNLRNIIEPDMLLEAGSHWGANYINLGFARGWFEYFGIVETFNPDAPIPRAQAVALLNFYKGRVPCVIGINAFLESSNRNIFPDLQRGHWSFYEVMEAAFTRYYYVNSNDSENWVHVLN